MKKGEKTSVLLSVCLLELISILVLVGYIVYTRLPPKLNTHYYNISADNPNHFQYPIEPGHTPEDGFISSAEEAERIGRAVSDELSGKHSLIKASVYHDEENRLWVVVTHYFRAPNGWVLIDQDTGQIIKFLYLKS